MEYDCLPPAKNLKLTELQPLLQPAGSSAWITLLMNRVRWWPVDLPDNSFLFCEI